MDFLRTLKRRKPKKHITARVNVVPRKSHRASSGGIRVKKLSATLNLASCLALCLGLAVVTQGQAQDYYCSFSTSCFPRLTALDFIRSKILCAVVCCSSERFSCLAKSNTCFGPG